MVAVLLAPLGIATVAWMCPSADGQIQTSVQAGGAIALSRRARRAKRSPRKDSGRGVGKTIGDRGFRPRICVGLTIQA
jgi:hypothetical protein